mmetsp:Transcript_68030/g.168059  ORF Transcript_68030/g.168059 Transcript_68030/m.168059 type:complete len:412 (-) Transcript_68030:108-1343(-)
MSSGQKKKRRSHTKDASKAKDVVHHPQILAAAMYGRLEEMKEFAMQDAKNLQARESDGWTVAHWAARRGHLEVLSFIADRAPTLLVAQANDGSTPAHYAAAHSHDGILSLLGDRDPGSLMGIDNEGDSPAHDASRHSRFTSLKLLVERCPSLIYGINKQGNRPIELAVRDEIREFLKSAEKASMVPAVQLQNLTKEAKVLNAQNAVLAFYCRQYWTGQNVKDRLILVADKNCQEYHNIITEFTRTMSKSDVLALYRVQERGRHEAFTGLRDLVREEAGQNWEESLMEKWLFYTAANLERMVKADTTTVFKSQAALGRSAPYGDGIYGMREASLAADDAVPGDDGRTKQMLVVRAVIGRYCQGKHGMAGPSNLPGQNRKTFTSMVDNLAEPMVFVLQNPTYLYPAYLVTYRD